VFANGGGSLQEVGGVCRGGEFAGCGGSWQVVGDSEGGWGSLQGREICSVWGIFEWVWRVWKGNLHGVGEFAESKGV